MMRCLVVLLASTTFAKEPSPAPKPDRVTAARTRRAEDLKALRTKAGLRGPPEEVYLRVFKDERVVELWAGARRAPLVLVKTYPVCAASGALGPKRREGDLQVPEGFYEIPELNPVSSYHLALKVGYPNASDRVRSDHDAPGSLIYLHGECASIGCIAIQNEPVEEVYLFVADAKARRIDIFPTRLTREGLEARATSEHAAFWSELAVGYQQFEQTHRPPRFRVDPKTGAYVVLTPPSSTP